MLGCLVLGRSTYWLRNQCAFVMVSGSEQGYSRQPPQNVVQPSCHPVQKLPILLRDMLFVPTAKSLQDAPRMSIELYSDALIPHALPLAIPRYVKASYETMSKVD